MNAVNNWLEFADNISKDDYLLMAKSCFYFAEYEKAAELLKKTDVHESWAFDVKNSYSMKNYSRAKFLTENGLQKYSSYAPEDEIIEAIDTYLTFAEQKNPAVERLLGISTGKGRDYLLNLKCQNTPQKDKQACYNNLYIKYPNGRFSADALANIFFSKVQSHDYANAKKVGMDHLNKFGNSNSAPMVMFWLGKIGEKTNNYEEYSNYYNNIIVKLVELGDYEVVGEFLGDDEFIKSWVAYKKGDYSHSMLIARDAMEKIKDKPDKYDLRWRLVYPLIYFDDVENYSKETGNSLPLMISLIREESYFDPLAQSMVGASGLMQLMPATASEINSKFGLGMDIYKELFNPKMNIKLGNYYYKFLRNNLEGYDVSSIAAYNGGIGSIQRWKTTLHYNDTDEFVEQIPYPETKNYVKKVFRSYWNYIRIYSGNN